MGQKSDTNYIRDNAYKTITAVPKKPVPQYIDAPSGKSNRFPLEDSGLVPKYVAKKDFGKVPEYLTRRERVWSATMQLSDL